jgi:hypothetical protein
MKKILHLFLLSICFLLIDNSTVFSQSPVKLFPDIAKKFPAPEAVLNNSAQGKDFWFVFPMNDNPNAPLNALEVYVTGSSNTVVNLEVPGAGFSRKKALRALDVVTFSTRDGSISPSWEVNSNEIPDDIAIHVFADAPVSVYVLSAKPVTSEGYLALPTSVWGTEYIHCSYYDFLEFGKWATGMCIIASEDDTEVSVYLRGKGGAIAKTSKGTKLGTTIKVQLMKGQVYNIKGDATTRGVFDMSGSKIVANKPVGLISYHQRCMIPANNTSGRDHISEMLPPVQAWGKKYATVEYTRDNKGDFFRIIASQNNTRWKMKYYDKVTGKILGNREGNLQAGEFYEEINQWGGLGAVESIRGVSVWEADKPVLVLQYSYSANWDKGTQFDPFYIVVTPQEQYIQATVFQTPSNSAFATNWFNVVAVGDSNDAAGEKLKSIVLDGKPIWITKPTLLSNRIPGTNLYWQNLKVAPGPHRITSNTVFGGYIYGFSDFDSYGWPAAMALKKLDQIDTLPPVLTKTEECGDFTYTATELRNFGPPPDTAQIDQGIATIEMIDSISVNYKLELLTADKIVVDPKVTTFDFKFSVIDKTKDAFAIFVVLDRAGNYVIDSIRYTVNKLSLKPNPVNFGKVRVNTSQQKTVKIKNESLVILELKEIKLQLGKNYKIISADTSSLKPGEERDIVLEFTPDRESRDDKDILVDSLMAKTQCAVFAWQVQGLGVRPCIEVEEGWDAGKIAIGNTVCKDQQSPGLRVFNRGSDTLTVTGILGVKPPFSVSSPTNPAFPFKIAPKQAVYFNSICYKAENTKSDSIIVQFESDSDGKDCSPNSLWIGTGIQPGLTVTDQDWGNRRVKTLQRKEVYVTNSGSAPANVTAVELQKPQDANFRIIDVQPAVSTSAPFILRNDGSKITVTVEYEPVSEGKHQTTVIASADNAGSASGIVKGFGILPKIQVTGYEFTPAVLVGSYAATDGELIIANTSTTAPLFIESIDFSVAGPNAADFEWKNPGQLPKNISILIAQDLRIPVRFKPTAVGKRIVGVDVKSDAAPGPDENPRIITNADIIGTGIETRFPDIKTTPIDYGSVILCDSPTGTATISNPGTDTLFIGSLELNGGDQGSFAFTAPNYPLAIPPGGSYTVTVTFSPIDNKDYAAIILVTPLNLKDANGNPKTAVIDLKGKGFSVPVEFSIDPPSTKIKAGNTIRYTIKGTCSDWTKADLKSLSVDMLFKEDMLKYKSGSLQIESGLSGWTFNAIESSKGMTFNGIGTKAANGSALFSAEFLVLLSDSTGFGIDLKGNTLDRSACVPVTTKPAAVTLDGCFINGRLISFSGSGFALKEISPNPIESGEIAIQYSIGFSVKTTIEIYNTLGEKIAIPVEQLLDAGDYRLSVPMNVLPNGNYFCRIHAGPFIEVKGFTINR